MIDVGHKTKQNILIDLLGLSEKLRGIYLDVNLINYQQYEALANSRFRLKYICDIVECRLKYRSLWILDKVSSYDSQIDKVTKEYINNEFGNLYVDIDAISHVLAEFDMDILNALPEHLLKPNWQVWVASLLGNTLLITNQGDYRVLMYFNDSESTRQKLMQAYPTEVLYQHE